MSGARWVQAKVHQVHMSLRGRRAQTRDYPFRIVSVPYSAVPRLLVFRPSSISSWSADSGVTRAVRGDPP